MSTSDTASDAPGTPTAIDGPPAAALIAAGVGAFVLGLFTTLAEASTGTKEFLQLTDDVGPLAGKTVFAVIAYFVSFLILGLVWRGRSFALKTILTVAIVLMALGVLMTFPPFFQAFASE